jgi:hypothetical protein
MIFWRILDNKLYSVGEVDKLGFEKSEGLRIPDEYLEKQEFTVFRTAHGYGDWGLISVMPRLLKEKYPDCKVYVPSLKLLEKMFGDMKNMWPSFKNPLENANHVFKNNPFVDGFKDNIDGEIFHDHYRVYEKNNTNIPLIEQMLKFWQFEPEEYKDSQPELYFSDEVKNFGDEIIKEYVGGGEFGGLLISDRYDFSDKNNQKIIKVLSENDIPYFYYTQIPLSETPFNFIKTALDFRHMDQKVQMYIRHKAKLNIGNQCGVLDSLARHTQVYSIQRQFPIGSNFVKGEIYL